jgi:hypothetical protein
MNKNLCTRKIKFILTIVNSSLLANPTLNKFFSHIEKNKSSVIIDVISNPTHNF